MDVIHFTICAADPLTDFDSKDALPAARRRPRRCQGRTLFSAFGHRHDVAQRHTCPANYSMRTQKETGDAMNVEGQCHCGQITFEAEIDPNAVRICHCTDCQTLPAPLTALRTDTRRQFRPALGNSQDLHQNRRKRQQARPRLLPQLRHPDLRRRTARHPNLWHPRGHPQTSAQLRPTRQIWFCSGLPWVTDIGDVPHIEQQ